MRREHAARDHLRLMGTMTYHLSVTLTETSRLLLGIFRPLHLKT
jgi:hypothetical protein